VINLDLLDLPQLNLSELSERFTEEEVHRVIRSLPLNKARRPDGFMACFLKVAWATIKPKTMQASDAFWYIDVRKFHAINEAIMVLLPKKPDAEEIKDYRLISLIHVLGKLFSMVLANRLAPRLGELLHITLSAFVKRRYIQDNFHYVQSTMKTLHVKRCQSLLLKVDISRAFDNVRDVISPDGSPNRFPDPRRALIGGACRFVAVGPPLAQRHIKERPAGAREPTFAMPTAPPQTLTLRRINRGAEARGLAPPRLRD
jgi:hypothetical protein